MLLLWVTVISLVRSELPQMEVGAFAPSSSWIIKHIRNQEPPRGDNISTETTLSDPLLRFLSESGQHEDRHGNSPCGCPCGEPTNPPPPHSPPSAAISTVPASLTLTCETPHPYEHISWWLYRCSNNGEYKNLLQLTSGSTLYFNGFDVTTGYTDKGYYSSLLIKDISSSTSSGLYQCVSHTPSNHVNFFSKTDHFVIGKITNKKDCFFDAFSRSDFKRKIEREIHDQIFRQPRIDERVDVQNGSVGNTLIFDFGDAIADPAFQLLTQLDDLKPPLTQNITEIPIQNSSYVRFDFTGGVKLQNRGTVTAGTPFNSTN